MVYLNDEILDFQGISVACLALAVILNQMCYNPDVVDQWTVGRVKDITPASNITQVGSMLINSLAFVSHSQETALKRLIYSETPGCCFGGYWRGNR